MFASQLHGCAHTFFMRFTSSVELIVQEDHQLPRDLVVVACLEQKCHGSSLRRSNWQKRS